MDTRKIIDYAQDGNAVGVRESLYASIWDRVHAAIEAKKQEIAQTLVAQESYEGSGDDEEDEYVASVRKNMAKRDAEKASLALAKQASKRMVGLDRASARIAKESYDDDEDPDVRIADKELKKRGVTLPKVKVDPDKDMAKLAKRTPKEKEED
jgi:hypothetical protein